MKLAVVIFVLVGSLPAFGQKLRVKVINRQDNETEYTYTIPGRFSSTSNANANCYGDTYSSCSASSTATGYSTPSQQISYQVQGATLTLLLPDGRAVVVNCVSKFAEHFAGPAGNHRSCRIPLVDNIEADFHGDKAKLKWPVSLDGKKTRSETYKILAILNKQ